MTEITVARDGASAPTTPNPTQRISKRNNLNLNLNLSPLHSSHSNNKPHQSVDAKASATAELQRNGGAARDYSVPCSAHSHRAHLQQHRNDATTSRRNSRRN